MRKETAIIFNSEMVRAILEGRKTVRRIPLQWQPKFNPNATPGFVYSCIAQKHSRWGFSYHGSTEKEITQMMNDIPCCKYGRKGDRLWVRETWGMSGMNRVEYRAFPADGKDFRSVSLWKPSIHMPRWASRITLEIVSVRPERLWDITEEDCKKEGCPLIIARPEANFETLYRIYFKKIWDSIYGNTEYRWENNPWVWRLEFVKKGGGM